MSGNQLLLSCRRTLTDWPAPDPAQERLRRRYLAHLDDHPDGWSRSCPGAHLTASSLICSEGRVLLTLHRKLGRWLQTGGHLEPGDTTLEDAAIREATEESGLPDLILDDHPLLLSEHEVPCGPIRPCYHLDVQYLIAGPSSSPVSGEESLAVQWFPYDRLPAVDRSVVDLVAAARARLNW